VIPLELLPRRCPLCERETIIGHGKRLREANDDRRQRVWIRRGFCPPCRKTFTILPEWLIPSAPFTLRCRRQACELVSAGNVAEQAGPHCEDPSRLPDPTTVRRWCWRRLLSVWCWLSNGHHFLRVPTIAAWDLAAFCRILPLGAKSP
jgi:hypothetical protein